MSALLPLPPLALVMLFVPESLTILVSKQTKEVKLQIQILDRFINMEIEFHDSLLVALKVYFPRCQAASYMKTRPSLTTRLRL